MVGCLAWHDLVHRTAFGVCAGTGAETSAGLGISHRFSTKHGRIGIRMRLGNTGIVCAQVFKANVPGVGHELAVKVARVGGQQFLTNEYRMGVILPNHDHVLRPVAVAKDRAMQATHLCYPLCRGGDLRTRLAGYTPAHPMPPEDARQLLVGITSGVRHLHQHGVIHRDLKPDNVLLWDVAGAHPVIADFGLSDMLGAPMHLFCGTLGYAPQEVNMLAASPAAAMAGIRLDGAVDVNATCIMAAEIFTGQSYAKVVQYWEFGVLEYQLRRPAGAALADAIIRGLATSPQQRTTLEDLHWAAVAAACAGAPPPELPTQFAANFLPQAGANPP